MIMSATEWRSPSDEIPRLENLMPVACAVMQPL